MVDALEDAWRVLDVGGVFVDLRPRPSRYPLDLVDAAETVTIGQVDTTGRAEDDQAADRAVELVLERGWFLRDQGFEFPFEFWWDTVGDLEAFVQTRKVTTVSPSFVDLEKRYRECSGPAGRSIRLRSPRRVRLAVYRKRARHAPP